MSEHCPYYVGQRVTPCADIVNARAIAEGIRPGQVYTIAAIELVGAYVRTEWGTWVSLRFVGINSVVGWYWRNFKPVTDISSLEALLDTTPVKTPEPVS